MTATLTDLDGGESGEAWQWARSSSRSGGFTNIQGANQATYRPGNDDTGMYLRATATYTDEHGGGKSASAISNNRTQWKASGPPQFLGADGNPSTETTRAVEENAKAGTNVGAPVAATDIGNRGVPEKLTYSLSDTDLNSGHANSFDIDQRTGQIKVLRTAELEYEVASPPTGRTYNVTVTAKDPSDTEDSQSRATIAVTINVTNVDEPPALTLPTGASNRAGIPDTEVEIEIEEARTAEFTHPEPVDSTDREVESEGTTPTLSLIFVADDPETGTTNDNTDLLWTLLGTDADDLNLRDGVLTFKSGAGLRGFDVAPA